MPEIKTEQLGEFITSIIEFFKELFDGIVAAINSLKFEYGYEKDEYLPQ